MFEVPTGSAPRRRLRDAGYTVGLLTTAILCGYGLLAPDRLGLAAVPPPQPHVVGAIVPKAGEQTSVATVPPMFDRRSQRIARVPPGARPEPTRPAPDARPTPDVQPAPQPAKPERPRGTWSGPVSGKVLDPESRPLLGASVVAGGIEARVGEDGTFTVTPPTDATLIVKRPGYAKVVIEPGPVKMPLEIVLRPQVIKAAYLTYFGFGDRGIRGRVVDMLERTELNAVVIDVKGDRGWIIYPTRLEQARAVGAQGPATLREFDTMMADLKARGIYTIARIVTFK